MATLITLISVMLLDYRYGSADLCRDQVNFLVELMKQSPPAFQPPSPLLSLTVRLIKCLAPEHQVLILNLFNTWKTLKNM